MTECEDDVTDDGDPELGFRCDLVFVCGEGGEAADQRAEHEAARPEPDANLSRTQCHALIQPLARHRTLSNLWQFCFMKILKSTGHKMMGEISSKKCKIRNRQIGWNSMLT